MTTKAKKTTLRHMLPDGSIATRSTAREYTCVLMGRRNFKATREAIMSDSFAKARQKDFNFYSSIIEAGVGKRIPGLDCALTARYVELAEKALEGVSDLEQYIEKSRKTALSPLPEGDLGPLVVLSWSATLQSATKLISDHPAFTDFKIEPINGGELR